MVQSSPTSKASEQQITQILGKSLSPEDFSKCLQQIQILEPTAGKLFWQSSQRDRGVYIITRGKVRLLDRQNNLLATIGQGESFGELDLFSNSNFQPYMARASIGLKVCYLPQPYLQDLLKKYPNLGKRFYRQALLWSLFCLFRQAMPLASISFKEIKPALSWLKRYHFQPGKVITNFAREQKFWLLYRGQLQQDSGKIITPGSIYVPSGEEEAENWQVTQPTELYSMSHEDWQRTLEYLPQLAELIKSGSPPQTNHAQNSAIVSKPSVPKPIQIEPKNKQIQPKNKHKINRAYFPSPTKRSFQWWQRLTRRYPFFAQHSAADCGAACLVMIGRYWGKNFSINRLRDIANVERHGASLRGLAAAAESIGFAVRPIKASLDKLAEQQLPVIAHWEGKHYIVVYEIKAKYVIVGDPAIGQRRLSWREFKAGWTGYALLLQPTVELKEAQEVKQPLWQFFELVKPHWLVLIEVFFASILLQVFGLVTPILTQLLLDKVVVQRSITTLTAVGSGLLIFGLFKVAIGGLRQYLLDHTANRIDMALIVGFIRHTFRLPLAFFESRYVGDIMARVQENRKIQRFLTGEALSLILDLLTMFVYVGVMFWYSWKLAMLVLVVVPPMVILTAVSTPFLKRISRQIFHAVAAENRYLIQALTGVRTVKSMAVEQTVRWQWEELLNKLVKKRFSGQVIGNQLSIISSSMHTIGTTALLWYGAWLVIHNELTIGQLVAFNMLLGNVISPFQRLAGLWHELQEVLIAVERINDVLDSEPEEDLHHQPRQFLPSLKGYIRFENVTFRYHPDSDANVLENINFEVKPGQTVALVGRSGSGKTTIAKLILGLYPPTEGKVLIDGQDVTSLGLRPLRQQIGVVDQDTFLFGNTIRENISLGHPEASLEEIMAAARQAGADSFIKKLPMGYETHIGEGGGLLSGGQRQRIAIARALLGNPPLLMFDEATSHLDAESERLIQTNLETILQDRTTVVIAHRLSTVRRADLILVLDRGVLVESGTHAELIAKQGTYYYLNQQQLAGIS